jgi:CHAT domain-containing protein
MTLSGRPEEAGRYLGLAFQVYHELGDSHEKAYGFINIGQTYRTAGISEGKPLFREEAIKSFVEAAAIAERVDDLLSISYAAGYLGQIKEESGLNDDALRLTRQALIAAQSAGAPESLYLWQWQLGRLLKAQGNPEGALSAYRGGVYTLQSIRQEFSGDCKIYNQLSFQNVIEPVYLGLVELLLRQADLSEATDNKPLTEAYLIEAVRNLELLKTAELQDYFQNTCMTAVKTTIERQDITIRNTLIVYFIPQPERLDIVLGSPAGIKKIGVNVDRTTLTRAIREFRLLLEKRTSREYLPYAQRLYDWLVRPFERELSSQEIDTIVFVPDGPLRTIPLSALHDGRTFLINRFAVAITPGMSLTDSRVVKREKVELLLTGLSESVQGFPALPYVLLEMKTIRQFYDSKLFLNSQFRIPLVRKELEVSPYSIVHIASHGEFSNNAAETYLLTWDERLTMDQLEQLIRISRFRKAPVELLTLSACQSAAGNDRAALGLAGLSVKAGARSALATLWYINDQASSDLVSEFYRQLSDPLVGKAKALQQAQLTLQKDRRYQHPCYWAPFLLVGNWR